MKKILRNALLAALLLLCLPVSARAESGKPIGNFEGHDDGGNTDSEETVLKTTVTMSDGAEYNPENKYFYYTVEKASFGLSVPEGSLLTGTVSVKADTVLTLKLYKGSTEVEDWNGSTVSAPGQYMLVATENDSTQSKRVQFTIVSQVTGVVKEYELPEDFFITSATVNGENAPHTQAYVDLSEEGDYVIEYRCPLIDMDCSLKLTIDNTAPTLSFTGIDEETHKAHSAVTVSCSEEGVKIYMKRNGEEITSAATLSDTGVYTVTARDEAGNESVYEFVIVAYVNSSGWMLLAALGLLLLAILCYGLYSRKYMRVR